MTMTVASHCALAMTQVTYGCFGSQTGQWPQAGEAEEDVGMPTITEVLPPRVRGLLCDYLGTEELIVNAAGEIPVRRGSAMFYIRHVDLDPPVLRVYAPVLMHVPASGDLYRALNE